MQRADRYEKRLKRRAGNRELKFLLNYENGVYNLPTAQQFEVIPQAVDLKEITSACQLSGRRVMQQVACNHEQSVLC